MAKIKVHELAKELNISSKDVLTFLQEKGIEVKAAQSTVEDASVEIVRKAFGKKGDTQLADNKSTVEEKKDVVADTQKTATEEAPKKKKKNIIFVSNPQNSKIPGGQKTTKPQSSQGQSRPQQNNQSRPNSYNNKPAAPQPARQPIKPLTPPSPTPSVQMVKSQPQPAPKAKPVEQVVEQPVKVEVKAPVTPEVKPAAPVKENKPAQDRPQSGYNNNRYQGDRNAQQRQGGYERGERNNDRNNERFNNDRGPRQAGQDRNQDRNGQYNRDNRDNRNQGNRTGGFNRNEGGMQGRSGFAGQGDRRNNVGNKGFGNKDFGGKDFGNKDKDERNDRGGRQGDKFGRDGRGSKNSFGGDSAPIKDTEKHREEEKRRISQEKDKKNKKDHFYEAEEAITNKPGRFIKPEKKKEEVVEEVIKVIVLPEMITIKDLAEKMKMQPSVIVKKLFMEGKIVTVNQEISYEDAENIAMEYEILCEKEVKVDVIEELLKEEEEAEEDLQDRPPVICVMGHVDHGKTSLLDAIRKTNVTDREAGGITQHIGAYTVSVDGRKITFLDTPGHEAFTAMRMRGATATDIAILVVAADDGVMPQTVEAISHAKAAGIEIVVAVNKIDKPSANIERVKQELTEYELISTDWGGTTEFVPVSAKSGEGIEDLLETILLTADILELKANPNRQARGLVIEAELDKGRGPVATVLVQKGTLHVGDFISAGACYGKVRAMIDDKGRRVKEATPSTPVEILGLSDVPAAGEVFLSHETDKLAKTYAETYKAQNKEKMLEETKSRMSLDDLFSQIQEGNLKELNLIVKADVQGSVEAVKQSLMKLSNEEVVVKCIHGGVGAINESDVTLAGASNAIIIGFNVRTDATAKATAEREGVDVRLYKVIYQAIEDVQAAMKGMLDPIFEEKVIGHAEVRQIFKASAVGNIAGSYVMDGIFQRGCKVRISREGKQIYEGELASLKRFKDDVKEVKTGFECGLVFDGFDQMQELDIVEAYIMVEVPR